MLAISLKIELLYLLIVSICRPASMTSSVILSPIGWSVSQFREASLTKSAVFFLTLFKPMFKAFVANFIISKDFIEQKLS